MPLLPEFTSEISNIFQFFLILIAVATAGYAIKVKFIGVAQKYTREVEKKVFNLEDPFSVANRLSNNHTRIQKLEDRVNSNEREIGKLDERSRRHNHEQ